MSRAFSTPVAPAFGSRGTVITINGDRLAEVTVLRIWKRIQIEANYIPDDPAHIAIVRALGSGQTVSVGIQFNDDLGTTKSFPSVKVDGYVDFPVGEAVKLKFGFEVPS